MPSADGTGDDRILPSSFDEGAGSRSDDSLREKLDRAESDNEQLEENLEAKIAAWKRERPQLLKRIEELVQALDQSRTEDEGADELKRRLEQARRYSEELERKCDDLVDLAEAERSRLQARIRSLEEEIVVWIDRTNNTQRMVESAQRRRETEFKAHKRTVEIESERKLRAEQVRSKKTQRVLEAEIERLKKQLRASAAPNPSFMGRMFKR